MSPVAVGALAAALVTGTAAAAVPVGSSSPAPVSDPTRYVDPMIGTSGDGFTVPGAATPFGMTMVSPDTTGPVAYTGYSYTDAQIRGFSLVHVSAAGVPIGGDLPFLPVTAPVADPSNPYLFGVPFSHADESASAGAYAVTLANGIAVDLAATTHGGLLRFAPSAGTGFSLLADIGRNDAGLTDSTVDASSATTLRGSSLVHWRGGDYTVFFAAAFSRPFTTAATYVGSTVSHATAARGTGAGAMLQFPAGPPVTMRVGVSYVDAQGAQRNLTEEVSGYDVGSAQAVARTAWRRELSRIRVGGGSTAEYRTFYTALYHALLHPDVDSDVDNRYPGPDGLAHVAAAGHRHYENFSLWDTIRGENALLATIEPERYADMVTSLSDYAEQDGGRLPRWSLHDTHPDYMNGDPAIAALATAVCRGLAAAPSTLYAEARHLAFDLRPAEDIGDGWVAGDAASTLEYADADFALLLMASRLGKTGDVPVLTQRAEAWRNLYHDGFLEPRNADGSWPPSYDPRSGTGYREGTGWQYLWLAPHDEAGLRDRFVADGYGYAGRLDHFFSVPLSTASPSAPVIPAVQSSETAFGTVYYGDQYVPGNEHDLEAPYLYDWAGVPSRTQAVVAAERSLFNDTPLGLPGNDDLGALSAWYVWSALGFYPPVAGAPVFVIGSPLFQVAVLASGDGDSPGFAVDAPGASSRMPYLQGVSLNGKALDRTWFTAADVRPGGRLRFVMAAGPTGWASSRASAPPSLSTSPVSDFGCAR